jgi:hypothetical protein
MVRLFGRASALAAEVRIAVVNVSSEIKSGMLVATSASTPKAITVRVRPDIQQSDIKAWMSIAVEGNQTRTVIASLLGEPSVATLHDTNGRGDLLAE